MADDSRCLQRNRSEPIGALRLRKFFSTRDGAIPWKPL